MTRRKRSTDQAVQDAYEAGEFVSEQPSAAELRKFRAAARATLVKDRRVNIRLSSPVLMDLQALAAEEGLPYQTLIASVLHKFVNGRLVEQPSQLKSRPSSKSSKTGKARAA